MPPFLFGYDFYLLWSAGALLHEGQNPYDLETFRHQLEAVGWPSTEFAKKFPHPVNTLWLYWMFALLPCKLSLALWSFASLVTIVACSSALIGALAMRGGSSKGLMLFSAALFPPTLGTLIWGQMSGVLLLGVTLFAVSWRNARYFLAGLSLSLVTLKPHLFVPFMLVIFISELRLRRAMCLLGCAMGVALQVGIACVVAPDCLAWYAQSLHGHLDESLQICGATLGQLVECSSSIRVVRPALVVVGSLLSLWLVGRRGYSLETLLGVVLPISVCVAPYSWMHSFVVLIPSVLLLIERYGARVGESTLRYVIVALAAGSLPLVVLPEYQAVWVLFSWSICLSAVFLTGPAEGRLPGREMRDPAS